ncbi:MAG: DUF1501 domain-containing protein [Planctomycetaceae bacterium]
MLTFFGGKQGYCDGVSRRNFLQIGALGAAGITLPGLLRAEAQAGGRATRKSLINIYLGGGPTHMDTFDLKPTAPKEYRGEFSPIKTNAAGVEICELMPHLAKVADRYSIIRSVTNMSNEHSGRQSDSGWSDRSLRGMGGRPSVGAVMSKLWGPAQTTKHGTAPTAVDLTGWTRPGFLGQVHSAYRPDGTGRANLQLNRSVSLNRLNDRKALLSGFDRMRKEVDQNGMMTAIDSFTDRAVGIITSGELSKALDIRNEDPRNVARYGDRRSATNFIVARRLIDAGVRCVSFNWGGWDTHGNNFATMRRQLPPLSQALAALIEDLEAHGKLDDTIIMMSGEFGRTPRINGNAGRDHWPQAAFFFLAGGGMQHGQVIGSTNRKGERPKDRPLKLGNIFHTLYYQLGIDANTSVLQDPNGRPQYLVNDRQLIEELV